MAITIEQEGFRWRDDNGSETSASWLAAQDTNISRVKDTNTRLRVLLNASGNPDPYKYQLESKLSTDSTWTAVGEPYTNLGNIVNESMSSTPGTGTIAGDATWESGGYIKFTPNSGSKNGSFYYSGTLPRDFTVTWDIYANGGADANYFFFGTTGYSGDEETADGGYRIYASEYHNLIAIRFNGSIIASYSYSNLGNSTWREMKIVKTGNNFSIKIDSTEVINYTDSTRSLGGSYYGWGARTGGVSAEHRGKNMLLTDNMPSSKIVLSRSSNLPTFSAHHDDFETGDMSQWNDSTTNGGDLSVTAGAALHGGYGLSSLINDTNDQLVQQTFSDAKTFRCRFYFDPNSLSMTSGDQVVLLVTYNSSWEANFLLKYGNNSGTYSLSINERTDNAWSTYLGSYTLTDEPHLIEILWTASTGPGNNNGTLYLWVDGSLKGSKTDIDNDTGATKYVQLGTKEKDSGTSGTLYFDDWAVNTTGEFIGSARTTAQLTAPSGKSTSDFIEGYIADDINPYQKIDITTDDYTEMEWSIKATNNTTNGEKYDFRVTRNGTVLDTYSVTPQLTVGSPTSSDSRDFRITGKSTFNDSRDIRLTGKATSNDTRDIRITGKSTSSDTRDIRITGKSTSSDTRDVRITGKATSSDSRDLRVTGKALSSDTRDLRITGKATSSDTRDIRVTGQATSNDARDIRITGTGLLSSDNRDLRLTGQSTANDSRDIRVTGKSTSSDSRDLRISGTATTNDTRDIRITGQSTSSDNRDIRLTGKVLSSDNRDLRLTGQSTISDTRDLRVTGQNISSDSRDLRIAGKNSSSDNRDIRITGQSTTSNERGLYITGVDSGYTTSERGFRITGGVVVGYDPDLIFCDFQPAIRLFDNFYMSI